MNIQDYLLSIGFIPHRLNDKFEWVVNYKKGFSSMVIGGIDIRYIKGNEVFVYGLYEQGKPPTLSYPLFDSCFNEGVTSIRDEQERAMKGLTGEEIYNILQTK